MVNTPPPSGGEGAKIKGDVFLEVTDILGKYREYAEIGNGGLNGELVLFPMLLSTAK